jgi:hypothetical protein
VSVDKTAPVHDAGTEDFKRMIDTLLAQFGSHEETILSFLRSAYDGGAEVAPFDARRAWHGIEGLAHRYYVREWVKREARSSADREARFREIGGTLGRAREMIDEATSAPDLADDLIWAWWEGTSEFSEARGAFVDLLYIEREFEKVLESLATLTAGAIRAADRVHKGRGRPRGTSVLPQDYIIGLASVYRNSTGSKPGAGQGPFAWFVSAFCSAIGRQVITDATVIDAIKDARSHLLQNPSGWGPSPFDE